MGIKPIIISIIFFIIGGFYHMTGVYVIKMKKRKTTRLFFVMTAIIWAWASAISFATIAKSPEISSIWFRLSIVGWGFFNSVFYHFAYSLAKPEKKKGLLFYLLVYTPALLNLAFFLLSKRVSHQFIAVALTEWGWTYMAPTSIVSNFFIISTVLFIGGALIEYERWYGKDEKIRRLNKNNLLGILVGVFLVIALILYFVSTIIDFPIIQAVALSLIVPIVMFFYIVLKYRFIDSSRPIISSQLLDDVSLEKLFDLLGYTYIMLTQIIFGMHFWNDKYSLQHVIIHCSLIYLVGISHFFINRFFKQSKYKYFFVSIAASFMILSDLVFHVENSGITIWAMYFFAAMVTAVFDRPLYSHIVIGTMIVTQIVYFKFSYNSTFYDWRYFITRILVIILTGMVIRLINKLYYSKRHESTYQFNVQETLAELSQNLVNINSQNKDSKIQMVLAECNQYFDSQQAYVLMFNPEKDKVYIEYFQHGSSEQQNYNKSLPANFSHLIGKNHWGVDEILSRTPVLVNDIERLPKEASNIQLNFRKRNMTAFHAFPITIDEDVKGVLFFEFNRVQSDDSDHYFKQVIANLIGDAIKKVSYEERLFRSAHIDMVTGFYNRLYFVEQLEQIINESSENLQHAVLFIDIDSFKSINDAFGHSIGDEVLHQIADIIKTQCDERHLLARFGGDEFVIAYTDITDRAEVAVFVNQILSAINAPLKIGRYEFRLSLSIGLSFYPQDGIDVESLVKNADLAMYASKTLGKNRCYYCNDFVKNQTAENINYTNKLLDALANGEIKQVYQPQMDIATGNLSGIEVLLRWYSPEFGEVPPAKFIPLLEHMGLIGEVGEWVIANTIEQHLQMMERGLPKVRMSINLSGVQLHNVLFIDKLSKMIEDKAIEPQYLELEILEKYIIDPSNYVSNNFKKLKEIGCLIAVDDFGVEFSSLNRLQELPIDRLKIDQRFIEGIGVDIKKESVIKIIIELAEELGFKSIAEGVETAEQFAFLRDNGCQEIQGFYYSKPLPIDLLEKFIIESAALVSGKVSS